MESGLLSCLPPLPILVWEVLVPLLAPPLDCCPEWLEK